jgi:prepilin-type processing-associated H-X9-DG protein
MRSGSNPDSRWAHIAAGLRAYRAARDRIFGRVDDAAVARYLTGKCTEQESRHIRTVIDQVTELRRCVELVRDVTANSARTEPAPLDPLRIDPHPPSVEPSSHEPPAFGAGPSLAPVYPLSPAGDEPPAPSDSFRLLEWVTGIGIAAILLLMLIPALQSAREAARRAQCVNNLKQIGLAIANYESANGSYPIGNLTYIRRSDNCATYWGYTWLDYILPYLEVNDRYNAGNFSRPYNSRSQLTAYHRTISTLICPDDTQNVDLTGQGFIFTMQTSYTAMRGLTENLYYSWGKSPDAPNADRCGAIDGEGVFGTNISYRVADVTDGMNNTIFAGEVCRFKNEPPNSVFNFGNAGGAWLGPDWVSGVTTWPGDVRVTSGAYAVPKLNAAAVINNGPSCINGNPFGTPQYGNPPGWVNTCQNLGQFGFRSNHPGGVNFLFGDGSVHFLKETIALPTYRALATRALGEVVSAETF